MIIIIVDNSKKLLYYYELEYLYCAEKITFNLEGKVSEL